jgi:hypothetical protein
MKKITLITLLLSMPFSVYADVFYGKTRTDAAQTVTQRLETFKELIAIFEASPEGLGDENGWARCREAAMSQRVKCHDGDKTDPFLCEIQYENAIAWCDMLNGGLPY